MNTRAQARFAYMWEYVVKDARIEEFRRTYGPKGDWVELFSKSTEFIGTDLYHDVSDPRRFVTTDFWTSREARDRFQLEFKSQFDELDRRCRSLTVKERVLGDFEIQVL